MLIEIEDSLYNIRSLDDVLKLTSVEKNGLVYFSLETRLPDRMVVEFPPFEEGLGGYFYHWLVAEMVNEPTTIVPFDLILANAIYEFENVK